MREETRKQVSNRDEFCINFLKEVGLKPNHSLLDIGCGPLKASIPLIEYLQNGNYSGFDINPKVIREAKLVIKKKELKYKNTTLFTVPDLSKLVMPKKFDFIIAYAVLLHVSDQMVRDIYKFVKDHLTDNGSCYMNAYTVPRKEKKWRTFTTVSRPAQFYIDEGTKQGVIVSDIGSMVELGKFNARKEANEMRMFKVVRGPNC